MEAPAKKSRPVNLFDVPESIVAICGVKEVGLIALTGDEELLCHKKAKGENAKLANELTKMALVEADGKPLSSHDGTVDTFWGNADPKLRQLILGAYAEIHGTDEEEQKDFLKTRRTRVA